MAIEISYLTTLPSIEGGETERASIEDFVASLISVEPLVSVPPLPDFDFNLDELIARITSGSDEGDSNSSSGAFLDMFDLFSTPTVAPIVQPETNAGIGDLFATLLVADMFDFFVGPATSDVQPGLEVADLLGDLITDAPVANGYAAEPAQAKNAAVDVKIGDLDAFDFLF